ncbi:unnamed protein product [Mycetohabitans rhizoxinica HKI 454]|uniref:Uncharacterized protein n=2 Tax=Mycetohabitans TaxID=2571159 RepID=E5AT25_MYCRK|nr:hypothetical protein [Mycetohabitans sp.]CBW73569.1 unnamed protein product [Mycetohabitans rhizoxinica HKI 454]
MMHAVFPSIFMLAFHTLGLASTRFAKKTTLNLCSILFLY